MVTASSASTTPAKPHPDDVRNLVSRAFDALARPAAEPARRRSAMQGDEPRLYGRFYWSAGHTAKWIVNDGVVEFYRRDGQKLKTIRLVVQAQPS